MKNRHVMCKSYCLCQICEKYAECKRCEQICKKTKLIAKFACMNFKQKKGEKL